MQKRLALLCDRSVAFAGRLRRLLQKVGCEVRVAAGRRELLKGLRSDSPSIVFIAVDEPRKTGFSIFTDVKVASKQTPVVLVTATLQPEEMRIHRTLQVHADAYLDKRRLENVALLSTVNALLGLELTDAEIQQLARKGRAAAVRAGSDSLEVEVDERISWQDGWSEEKAAAAGIDPEFVQRSGDSDAPPATDVAPQMSDAERCQALEEELRVLHEELEEMRCAVKSTPFSEEYRTLKGRTRKAEEESAALRKQITGNAQRVRDLERKLVDAEFQVRSLKDSEAAAQEQFRSLEEQVAKAVEERVSVEHEWAQSMEELKSRAEEEKIEAARVAEATARAEIEEFKKRQSESLASASERTKHEVSEAVSANEASWRARLAQAESDHSEAMETEKAEHEAEISRLIEEHARKLLDKEKEFREAMTHAAAAHELELSANSAEWKARLERAQEDFEAGRSADCEALEERYRKELQDVRTQHIKERERLQKMHAEGLESLSAKLRHKYLDPVKIKHPLLRSKMEEKLREREAELAAAAGEGGEKD